MAAQGIVSFSFDPDSSNLIAQPWCDDLAALRTHGDKLLIRTQIRASSANNLPTASYKAAIELWTQNGHEVAGVLPLEFDTPRAGLDPKDPSRICYPNEQLGFLGNPLLNPYIQEATLRAEGFARQLVPAGLKTYWVWNEPNTKVPIVPGDNCPNGTGFPTNSLAPQVFAALVWQGCTRLKAAGVEKAYVGSLSVLKDTGTDPNGPYLAGYLEAFYGFLRDHGVTEFPWDALSLDIEGLFDQAWAQSLLDAVQNVQGQFGDHCPVIVGEWGVSNTDPRLTAAAATETFNAINAVFPAMYFFQHGQYFQGKLDWGATQWGAPNHHIVPAGSVATSPLPWRAFLKSVW